MAVNIDRAPRFLIPYKPDWHAAEVVAPRRTDFYDSDRALGHLYRAIQIDDIPPPSRAPPNPPYTPFTDPISTALRPLVVLQLENSTDFGKESPGLKRLFHSYADELSYICLTHSLTTTHDVRLTEEEVVVGTILAKCSQRRWRKDKTYRMRTHAAVLVQETQRQLINYLDRATKPEIQVGLTRAWAAWEYSLQHAAAFGANSFGLLALGVIFDCLDKLETL